MRREREEVVEGDTVHPVQSAKNCCNHTLPAGAEETAGAPSLIEGYCKNKKKSGKKRRKRGRRVSNQKRERSSSLLPWSSRVECTASIDWPRSVVRGLLGRTSLA